MKHLLVLLLFPLPGIAQLTSKTENVFIVTLDGIRWQEIFKGADPAIINNQEYTSNIDLAKLMYLDSCADKNRGKLMPFFWNVIQNKGRLYGNRAYKNHVNVANNYKFSYPGYNEIFTGYPDIRVNANKPAENLNVNVLEYLNTFDEYKNKVVAFSSWNIISYILGEQRNDLKVFSGYDSVEENNDFDLHIFNKAQQSLPLEKSGTRQDALTFIAATEYIKANKPRVVFIGFGECDEDAHKGEYDKYLEHLNDDDKMIQQLWYYIQSTKEYKNKTTLIITTDHGRGKKTKSWTKHDALIKGSGDAWLAIIGPDFTSKGEMQLPQQLYQKQIASTIANLLGHNFTANHPVSRPIDFQSSE
ncbi:MAG: alkaline phosphatase family protein [Bacteroidota bacterium]|nr:alkaline phosphatase family protein [Bacteroidota bacterium]